MNLEEMVNFCKQYGFIFQGSEIYGGLANTWDYGPLGAKLKNNLKDSWRNYYIRKRNNAYEIDADILMNPEVWVASGHVGSFSDPLIDCKECKARHRADHLIEGFTDEVVPDTMTDEEMVSYIKEHNIPCPSCGKSNYTDVREFNLMFETNRGVIKDATSRVYLRPETAQGEFVNFLNVQRSMRAKVPFGIGQIGKSFRNEITPGNFIFRIREFEQMELEFFCQPGTDLEWYEYWKKTCKAWLMSLGAKEENFRLREHSKEELSFYSKGTTDIEYKFPFGWGELWGIADRTDYDLSRHMEATKADLTYLDPETNEKYVPYCVEPSVGVDRLFLMFLCDAYDEQEIAEGDVRTVLHLHPALAPIKAAILPLSKKLAEPATKLFEQLSAKFMCEYDEAGSIGKRYRREDEIGTPFCITYDFDSETDGCVTIRDRDSMEQVRIKIDEVENYISERLKF